MCWSRDRVDGGLSNYRSIPIEGENSDPKLVIFSCRNRDFKIPKSDIFGNLETLHRDTIENFFNGSPM